MRPATIAAAYLRATALNDVTGRDALPEDPAGRSFDGVVDAALGLVLHRMFPNGYAVRDVTLLVVKMRRMYPDVDLPLLDVEALLRRRLGEDTPVNEIDDTVVALARLVAFGVAVHQLALYPDELDAVLAEAEAQARERGFTPTPLPH